MVKIILGVLSLLVMLSCSTAVKENTTQPDIMETNKKNLGNLLALYPKPMTVVGAEVEGKVNWLVVGHTGVIGHDRILVSMSKSHYTNQGIKKSKRLSVNLVSREMLPKADYVGSVPFRREEQSNRRNGTKAPRPLPYSCRPPYRKSRPFSQNPRRRSPEEPFYRIWPPLRLPFSPLRHRK